MAIVNHAKKEINAKIVYAGPQHAGKKTNLEQIYRRLAPSLRGSVKTMPTEGGRILFFDFSPEEGSPVPGYALRFHLYSVQGPFPSTAWKLVLKGADGIVFVADSAAEPDAAADALAQLEALLDPAEGTPLFLQYNKRDLPEALPLETMQQRLNPLNAPVFPASAATGEGVAATFGAVVKGVMRSLLQRAEEEGWYPEEAPASVAGQLLPEDLFEEEALPAAAARPPQEPVLTAAADGETELAANEPRLELLSPEPAANGELAVPLRVTWNGGERLYRLTVSLRPSE